MAKNATYEVMGIAAMLPGMRHMVELMQRTIVEMEDTLRTLQEGGDLRKKRRLAGNAVLIDEHLETQLAKKPRKLFVLSVNHPNHPDNPKHKSFVRRAAAARRKKQAARNRAAAAS